MSQKPRGWASCACLLGWRENDRSGLPELPRCPARAREAWLPNGSQKPSEAGPPPCSTPGLGLRVFAKAA